MASSFHISDILNRQQFNNKCTEVQNPRATYRAAIQYGMAVWHECMFETNNTPAFHAIHTRYCWIRIHTFGLKASTEKVKQPNWNKTNEMTLCSLQSQRDAIVGKLTNQLPT